MKQIAVVSGKGGTGKTTLTASFVSLANDHVIVDCDVDAADLYMLMDPKTVDTQEYIGNKLAEIDSKKCIQCDICESYCRPEAISDYSVDPFLCDGCGVCVAVCPEGAIKHDDAVSGEVFRSDTKYGPFVHAQLAPSGKVSGKLVTQVRNEAGSIAEEENRSLIIIDGPPGTGCPVIATLSGVDLVLAVTEPTLSGIHGLKRVLAVVEHFGIPSMICINKYDLNEEITEEIYEFGDEQGIEVVGRIPFNPVVTESMVSLKPLVEYSDGAVSREIKDIWKKVLKRISMTDGTIPLQEAIC